MRLISEGFVDRAGVPGLARRLAVSERQLHRLLVDGVGAPALALARSQRAETARLLIASTDLPFAEIAFAAGFGSVRQFNATIRDVFGASPSALRGARRRVDAAPDRLAVRLAVRRPYDHEGLVAWLGARAVPGVEEVSDGVYRRALRLPGGPGVVAFHPGDGHVRAAFRLAALADLPAAARRCRRLLDLSCDPAQPAEVLSGDAELAPLVAANPGLRAPGTVDPDESAVRTVLGQQISLRAARTLVVAFGTPLEVPDGGLTHAFPTAQALAAADLTGIGLPGARQSTLRELARRIADGRLVLDGGVDRDEAQARLTEIRGIGPWTATYIALRALGDPDALPAGDLGLRHAARRLGLPADPAGLAARAERWRPWRTYAAHHLWAAAG
jgi:AraC family transcriptional regulator of adaptative response / DNA-3-methyladenine glycosylase II